MLHTLFLPILVLLIVGFGLEKAPIRWPESLTRFAWYFVNVMMIATLAVLLINVVYYLMIPGYFDLIEENIAAVAAFWRHGNPLYHTVNSGNQYSLLYGPLPTLTSALFQKLNGDILFLSKLPGVLSFFIGGLLWITLVWRQRNWNSAKKMIVLAIFSAVLIFFDNIVYWNRADSYILMFTIVALFVVETQSSIWQMAVMTGILAGLASAGKIHAAGAIFPLVVYYFEKNGIQKVALPLALFGAVALISTGFWFFLPNVSLANYLSILKQASGHGLEFSLFTKNLTFVLPGFVFLGFTGFHRKYPWTMSILTFMCLLTAIVASKAGAGAYHLLPFLPALLYFGALSEEELFSQSKKTAQIFAGCCFLGIFTQLPKEEKGMIRFWLTQPKMVVDMHDLETLEQKYPGPKSMAPTDDGNFALMQLTPKLIENGGRLFVDSPVVMDLVQGHGQLPEATYQTLVKCEISEFILPSKGLPWTNSTWYTGKELYPERLRAVFNANYEKIDTVGAFSLYRCKHQTAGKI